MYIFGTNVPKKSGRKKIWTLSKWLDIHKDFKCQTDLIFSKISIVKIFQYSQIVYIKSITRYKLVLFLFFLFFFHILRCNNSTMFLDATISASILHLSFFKFFVFFKFNMPSQKSDKNNSIRIIISKVIVKVNVIKIYIKNTHFMKRKYNITRIFIKVTYIIICAQTSKKFFKHFTCK